MSCDQVSQQHSVLFGHVPTMQTVSQHIQDSWRGKVESMKAFSVTLWMPWRDTLKNIVYTPEIWLNFKAMIGWA